MSPRCFAWLLFLLVLSLGCRSSRSLPLEPEEPAWFTDVTDALGLNVEHEGASLGSYFMPRLTGGGVALFDFDNDGRLDLYLVQNGGPSSRSTNRLFRQKPDGSFQDVSAGSGLDVVGHGQGVAIGDVNNDGWSDVVVTEYGGVRLFLNRGNGTFVESTQSGLNNPLWATSAAFVDYDRDGWLDLVVVNYLDFNKDRPCAGKGGQPDFCGPSSGFPSQATRLFRNLGQKTSADPMTVRFQDVTASSGLGARPGPGLGIVCADFNGDRWPDLFVANDGKPNHLWINKQDGTFAEEGVVRGVAFNALGQPEANMGVAIGDADGDGLFDLFVTHLHEEHHRLWLQSPRGQFQDQTGKAGLTTSACRSTGFGALMADFDHDGFVDLVVANGKVRRDGNDPPAKELAQFWAPYRQQNHLHANTGRGGFRSRSQHERALCGVPGVWRAIACGDIDNDGALDLIVTRLDGSARLLRNVAPNRGNWLRVRAFDPALKRDAHDAEITVTAGSRTWRRWANPGHSYVASNDPRVHFGFGSVDRLDSIDIVWPDGFEERFPAQPVNQSITLSRGKGKAVIPRKK